MGFARTELLVALALMAILFLLVIPSLNTWREKRNRSVCAGNLRQIGVALLAYAGEHQRCLPTIYDNANDATWDAALLRGRYVSVFMFRCPSDRTVRPVGQQARTYALSGGRHANREQFWIQGSRIPCSFLSNSSQVVIVGERLLPEQPGVVGGTYAAWCDSEFLSSAHYPNREPFLRTAVMKESGYRYARSNYLFLDGHVEWVEPADEGVLNRMFPVNPGGRTPCP
jgi:prepilin-type processing-associated H-X9-DG protein